MSQQLHFAGHVLRFHDYPKLREWHHARLRLSQQQQQQQRTFTTTTTTTRPLWNPSLATVPAPSTTTTARSMSFLSRLYAEIVAERGSGVSSDADLKKLERMANRSSSGSPSSNALVQLEFIHQLFRRYPELVVQRYPQMKHVPMDGNVALIYLLAMQKTNQYSFFRLDDLLQRMNPMDPVSCDLLRQEFSSGDNNNNDDGGGGATNSTSNNSYRSASGALNLKGVSTREQLHRAVQVLSRRFYHYNPNASSVAADAAEFREMDSLMNNTTSPTNNPLLGAFRSATGGKSKSAELLLPGMDPSKPLTVRVLPHSVSRSIIGTGLRLLLGFVAISAIATLIDDKGVGKAFGITQSGKHIQEAEQSNIRFDDVKGVAEAKAELVEIVEFLKDPSKFTRLGGELPRGLLLIGPPGTGKTLLAKAVAGEAGVPFFFSSGSQFEEVYVGLGARRVRELFEAAKKKSPCIVFIDEIDALGGTRKLKDQSALKMTLNELLVQLDGFEENTGIIVIGATNFADSLDAALLRPGRFDKHVTVPLPDIAGRKEILEMYATKTTLAEDVDLDMLARGTTGMSGADLHNLMNQAAVKASVDGLSAVTMAVLEYAKDKILMGAERTSAVLSDETKRCTAFHEAGHAIVATLTKGAVPIHKATIMPRGSALGMVTQIPEGDQTSQTYQQMLAMMDVAMGGRIAEELIFGEDQVTSGAYSDIRHATRVARGMVSQLGFSDKVGIVFHDLEDKATSAETRACIDAEVKRLTDESYARAKHVLETHRAEHLLLAECLLEFETLTGEEVRNIVLHRRKPNRAAKSPPSTTTTTTTTKSNNNKTDDKNKKNAPATTTSFRNVQER